MTQKLLAIVTLSVLVLAGCGGEQTAEQQETVHFETAAAISAAEFIENIKYLAADELKGRGNGTEGLAKAAAAIAGNFKDAGLSAFGDDYYQGLEVQTGSDFGENNSLTFSTGSEEITLAVHEDYIPLSHGDEAVEAAELVFAGYGISAPDKNYNDYEGLDVDGKVVLVLDLEPQRDNKESVFDGSADSQYATPDSKIIAARMQGAAGIIIFRGPKHITDEGVELPKTGPGFKVDAVGIPGIYTTYEALQPVIEAAGLDIAAIQDEIDAELANQSRSVEEVTASIAVDVTPVMATVNNVIGYLPGTDETLQEEYVVVGAHYDHLGLGYRGSMQPDQVGEIHNGADDNASGTSGLMELAEFFAAEENRPARSLLFIAFAGEEWGLLGSAYFVDNPTVEKEKLVAMLNMDMIGRADDGQVTVGGVGTAELYKTIMDEITPGYEQLKIITQESGFASSDNASFTAREIPALFYFTGTHGDYHKPSDDWDKIKAETAVDILDMIAVTISRIANAETAPEYVHVAVDTQNMRTRGGARPWFGSMPDFGYQGEGYKFNMITEGSPADLAGFQGGDIMIRFGDAEVSDIYDYTAALRSYQPGDEVDVTVLRDGEEITSTVKLVRRPGK